jgi:hypothetical protein
MDARFHPERTLQDNLKSNDAFVLDEIDKLSARPDFAIISYGRLSLDPSIPGTFGMEAITGKNAPQSLVDAIDPVKHVTAQTSPSFIYATERDEKVNSLNATLFFIAKSGGCRRAACLRAWAARHPHGRRPAQIS